MARTTQEKKVLLLGASGKLGTMLRRLWTEKPSHGFDIIPIFRKPPMPDGAMRWQPGDPAPGIGPVAAVVALWGVTPGGGADPAENRRLALEAQRLAAALGAGRVLHASSAAVYRPGMAPLSEATAPDPQTAYGCAKLEMERALAVEAASAPAGPKPCILRIGNVAGADSLFASLAAGRGVTLDRFADGQGPRRSYIAPQDLSRAIIGLLRCPIETLPPVVNVAAPRATAMQEIALAAGSEVAWRPAPATANPLVELDTRLLQGIATLPQEAADPAHLLRGWQAQGAAG